MELSQIYVKDSHMKSKVVKEKKTKEIKVTKYFFVHVETYIEYFCYFFEGFTILGSDVGCGVPNGRLLASRDQLHEDEGQTVVLCGQGLLDEEGGKEC